MKTKSEIVEETIQFYTEDPLRRAVCDRICEYITPDGRRCAVGRYMINPEKFTGVYAGAIWAIVNRKDESKSLTQDDLVEEVRGHDWEFWGSLQNFHDGVENWSPEGLTVVGQHYANVLRERYGKDN